MEMIQITEGKITGIYSEIRVISKDEDDFANSG